MIKINNLKVKYGNTLALNVTEPFEFMAGDRVAIVGVNGAGKSSLVNAIINSINYEGNIECNRSDIAVHFQHNDYNDKVSLTTVIELITKKRYQDNLKIQELINYFNLQNCLKKKFKNLSGGEKQKFTLCLVLYQNKPITFFDEPTTGLDYIARENLIELLSNYYQDHNCTVGYVTHYYEEIKKLANKLLLIDQGNVICYGDIKELFHKYCSSEVFIIDAILETNNYDTYTTSDAKTIIKSSSTAMSKEIANYLIDQKIAFTHTDFDISLLIETAKSVYYGGSHE